MDVTQLSGGEFLRRLAQLNANSATMPQGKALLAEIDNSSPQNRERLVLELLRTAEEEVKQDISLSESLAWAVAWCSSIQADRRAPLRNGLVSILTNLSERLTHLEESTGQTAGRNPPFADFIIALIGLWKIDQQLCNTKLKELEALASGGTYPNLSVALKQFKRIRH